MGFLSFIKRVRKILSQEPDVPGAFRENRLVGTILNRRSVRRFRENDVKDEEMALILEAGRLAPSTVNMQTWSFGVYTEKTWRRTFGVAIPFGGKRAVVVLGDMTRMKSVVDLFPDVPLVEYTVSAINASLAAMNMTIMAEALGIGSVMLSDTGKTGFFSARYLKETLKLPAGVYPLMTVVFGYARQQDLPMPPKFDIEDIIFSGKYEQTSEARVHEWLSLMEAGYKASHFFSSFKAKLRYYRNNLERAEGELQEMVFGKEQAKTNHEKD